MVTLSHKIENRAKSIILLILGLFILYNINKKCSKEIVPDSTSVKTDTTYVDKTIKVPEVIAKFKTMKPVSIPTIVPVYDQNLIAEYQKLKDENEKLKKYKEAVEIRSYKNTYVNDKDSTVTIEVFNSVTGTLNDQEVNVKVKEREIKYQEKIITNTITEKYKPSFIISAGGSITSNIDPINLKPSVGAVIGFKNKKGYILDIGYNTNKTATVIIKKDILTFWSNKKNNNGKN